MYPEMNRRAGRMFSIADRIIDCFKRSENGTEAVLVPDVRLFA
jgi:cytochrome c